MRKRISSELKGKVAIAALQGHRTVNEIASEHEGKLFRQRYESLDVCRVGFFGFS